MQALDSSYVWGINPKNAGNLTHDQVVGLGALAPQSGIGLPNNPAPMTPLAPFSNLPEPNFDSSKGGYFTFGVHPESWSFKQNADTHPAPEAGSTPYFDPNYPVESMVALRDSLKPQIKAGVDTAMSSRGLGYSGVGKYAEDRANNYLSQLAPDVNSRQAFQMDLSRLYGPNVVNAMTEGGWQNLPSGGAANFTPSMTGLDSLGGGGHSGAFSMYENSRPDMPAYNIVDNMHSQFYMTPGYFYDPNHAPDASKMPWLKDAQYSGA